MIPHTDHMTTIYHYDNENVATATVPMDVTEVDHVLDRAIGPEDDNVTHLSLKLTTIEVNSTNIEWDDSNRDSNNTDGVTSLGHDIRENDVTVAPDAETNSINIAIGRDGNMTEFTTKEYNVIDEVTALPENMQIAQGMSHAVLIIII